MERQYGNPEFETTTNTPTTTPRVVAAPPITSNDSSSVNIGAGPETSAFYKDVNPTQRVYGNPEFEAPTEFKTVVNEPKNIYESAVMASPQGQFTTGTDGKKQYDSDVESAFVWEPKPPTSGVGSPLVDATTRAYGPALVDYMASQGVTSTKDILQPKYEAAYTKVMEGHGVPVMPPIFTLESQAKYNQEMADYNARVQSAKAAGLAAVQTEKEGLTKKAAEWADNIAKENLKTIGKDGEMLFDPSKRQAANAILNNEIQIKAVQHGLSKATTLPEIIAQIPALAYSAGIARNPEQPPTEFAITETKGIVDQMLPEMKEVDKVALIGSYGLWLAAKWARKDPGPSPLDIAVQKAAYSNPDLIKGRMQDYMKEVGHMNNVSKSNYIKHSKDADFTPDSLKPKGVEIVDFNDPAAKNKTDMIFGSLLRWNKMTSLSPEEVRLGIKNPNKTATGENEGVAAFQSYLKKRLGATNYKVTGIPSEDDKAALTILLKQNPSMSAKDVISEALSHKADMDSPTTGKVNTPSKAPKTGRSNKRGML